MSCCFLLVCSSILIMTPKRSKSYIVLILILRVRTITRVPLRARRKRTKMTNESIGMEITKKSILLMRHDFLFHSIEHRFVRSSVTTRSK